MPDKNGLNLRIGRTIYKTWVVENCSGHISTLFETCNKTKAQGVLEYLNQQKEREKQNANRTQ